MDNERLQAENERLKLDNERLRIENERLKAEIAELEKGYENCPFPAYDRCGRDISES